MFKHDMVTLVQPTIDKGGNKEKEKVHGISSADGEDVIMPVLRETACKSVANP